MHKQLKEIEKLLRNKRRLVANLSGDDEEVFIRVVQVFVEPLKDKINKWKASFCRRCRRSHDRHKFAFRINY